MSQKARAEGSTEGRGIATIVREFDFPRKAVFNMFTDPTKAAKWFGTPEGAENIVVELEARPGGAIRIHDRQPGESVHKTTGTVLDVVEPERFVFKTATQLEDGVTPFEALQTVTLEEVGPKRTRMVVVVKVLSAGAFPGGAEALVEGFTGGWGQSLDKLERALR